MDHTVMSRHSFAFDTEDKDGDLKLCVFYDGVSYYVAEDKYEAREFISHQVHCDFWAHNLEYDLVNVYQGAFDQLGEMIYSGSKIIYANIKSNRFYDTMNHYPTTLAKIGKQIGLEKIETDDFINLEYCMRDTEIVDAFINKLRNIFDGYGVRLRSTMPSNAISVFKKHFFPGEIVVPIDCLGRIRQGYYGGRCEIFKMGEIKGNIHKYDVNSLYPYVMKKYDYPSPEYPREVHYIPDYGMACVKIVAPDMYFPILPIKYEGKLIFPIGEINGVYPTNLLMYALENGYELKYIYWGLEYNGPCRPFIGFVNEFYPKRKGSDIDSKIFKLLMNSLYGKFAQGCIKTLVTIIEDDGDYYLETNDVIGEYPKWSNHVWSAWVTGYALRELHIWLERLMGYGDVLYCDTDGIVVNSDRKMRTSNRLGGMKIEQTGEVFQAKLPKLYRLDKKYRAKGIPRKYRQDYFDLETVTFDRPIRLREGLKRDLKPNVWTEHSKTKGTDYNKRRVLRGGKTRPWVLKRTRSSVKTLV